MPEPTETPEPEKRVRRRRRRSYRLKADEVAQHVLEVVRHTQDERDTWLNLKAARYAKYRGWLQDRDWPWENSSNQHLPVMIANSLRMKAGLFNAVLGIRPVMTAKTLQRHHKDAGDRVASLIDHQVFMESEGEERISQFIDQFVDDGTVFAFCRWSRDKRTIHDVRVLPTPEGVLSDILPDYLITTVFEGRVPVSVVPKDDEGYEWEFTFPPNDEMKDAPLAVAVSVYDKTDEDGLIERIEVVLEWEAVVYDGPTFLVHELEDIVAPMRSANLQSISLQNPFGAPWVARIVRTDTDSIRRGQKDGTYDLLNKEDLEAIETVAQERIPHSPEPEREDQVKALKDTQAGLEPWPSPKDKKWVTLVEWYGRWDMNNDGLEEDVIFTVVREANLLARARYLTEIYPGLPPRRPFAEARPIPVPGQLYGIGYIELMEGVHDLIHHIFNQMIDAGTIANVPPFFYRASSAFKPDVIRYYPGEGIPLDNPQQDIAFPNIPGRDQGWAFNVLGLAIQMMDRLVQIGPLQLGQVPTGKASALRTVGTTMALLQQGAAMPEQVLRRLFSGLAQIWSQFHALNTKYLPRNKEFLVAGKPLDHEDAYGVITDPQSLMITLTFDFQATLLNTNKGLMAQSLQAVGQAIASPLAITIGMVDKEQLYNWAKDFIQAYQLDPARYLKRPENVPEGPRLTAEDVIGLAAAGVQPTGAPLEPPQEHLMKIQQFMQSPDFVLIGPKGQAILQNWMRMVMEIVRAEFQKQQLIQAAGGLQQALGQGQGGGGGGTPTTMEAPPMQTETPGADELAGATMGAS